MRSHIHAILFYSGNHSCGILVETIAVMHFCSYRLLSAITKFCFIYFLGVNNCSLIHLSTQSPPELINENTQHILDL